MKKDPVQQQFGKVAAHYAASKRLDACVQREGYSLSRLVQLLKPKPGHILLDVATGTGHTALAFAPWVKQVVATDMTREMMNEGLRLAFEKGIRNVKFQFARAEALPFPDGKFDLVVCRTAAHHFTQVNCGTTVHLAVREMGRVAKKGGKVGIVDLAGHEDPEIQEFVHTLEVTRDPSHVKSYTLEEWKKFFLQAGLKIYWTEKNWTEIPEGTSLLEWCRNALVPPESVEKMKKMLQEASSKIQKALQITVLEDDVQFKIWKLLLVGIKELKMHPLSRRTPR